MYEEVDKNETKLSQEQKEIITRMKKDVNNQLINEKKSQMMKKRWQDCLLVVCNTLKNKENSKKGKYNININMNQEKQSLDLESRILYFQNMQHSSFRGLYYIYQTNKEKLKELESSKIGKLKRKKIKIERENVLLNAIQHFKGRGEEKEIETVMEFEFTNEEGSGLGPTLEFYNLVVQQVISQNMALFRLTTDGTFFPLPQQLLNLHNTNLHLNKQSIFYMLGHLLARAILDQRLLDFSLSQVWWKILLNEQTSIYDIELIDSQLAGTLLTLQGMINKKHVILSDKSLSNEQKQEKIKQIKFTQNSCLSDLQIYFTFPGYDDIELIQDGSNVLLDITNIELYLAKVQQFFFHDTISSLLLNFKNGFNNLIHITKLNTFYVSEIEKLYSGDNSNAPWNYEDLKSHIIPSYGYHEKSQEIKNLLLILSKFDNSQQKSFLKFITGCPRLPIGGFKNLHPKLTVVKKQGADQYIDNDTLLPSVMTCQNYLKLPQYSSLQIMQQKLLYVMKEGQNSFTLS